MQMLKLDVLIDKLINRLIVSPLVSGRDIHPSDFFLDLLLYNPESQRIN